MPAAFTQRAFSGLERREVEKRIYGVRKETAHGFRRLSWLQNNPELWREYKLQSNKLKRNSVHRIENAI